MGKTGSLTGNTLKDIVDKAVHDAHGLAGDASVGVHLLQNFVDVDAIALSSPPPPGPSGSTAATLVSLLPLHGRPRFSW